MQNDSLLNIWRNACRSHYFDEQVYKAIEDGRVKCFTYLSSGQEVIAACVAEGLRGIKPHIFGQHRGHSAYISFGGNLEKLRDELIGLPTGCVGGVGGDPMIHDPAINFWGHSGLVADQVPIAVGYAFASRQPVICWCGDATVEEDVFWPAVGFAATHNLPVLFVVENNNLSVVTSLEKRRSWSAVKVASGFGLRSSAPLSDKIPLNILDYVRWWSGIYKYSPMFLEIGCCRKYRHVGIGDDGPMAWDAMSNLRDMVERIPPCSGNARSIEDEAIVEMEALWA